MFLLLSRCFDFDHTNSLVLYVFNENVSEKTLAVLPTNILYSDVSQSVKVARLAFLGLIPPNFEH